MNLGRCSPAGVMKNKKIIYWIVMILPLFIFVATPSYYPEIKYHYFAELISLAFGLVAAYRCIGLSSKVSTKLIACTFAGLYTFVAGWFLYANIKSFFS